MPSSSFSSRIIHASGVSPASTLPPGNSQRPASGLPSGRWQISTRPSTSTRAAAAASSRGLGSAMPLGAVVAVDLDVALGEVAGPHLGGAAADAHVDADFKLLLLHVGAHLGLVVVAGDEAILGGPEVADLHAHPVAVHGLVGAA